MCSSGQGITTEKYKAKAIQTDLSIYRHITAYSDIFRHQPDIVRHIQAYSEPC